MDSNLHSNFWDWFSAQVIIARAAAVFYLQCLQILKQHFNRETITLCAPFQSFILFAFLEDSRHFSLHWKPRGSEGHLHCGYCKKRLTREERSGCRTGQVQELKQSREGMLGKRRLCGAGEEVRWVKCKVMRPKLRAAAVMCPTQHVDEKTHTHTTSIQPWMTNDKVTNVASGGRAGVFNALKQKSHNARNAPKDRESWKTLLC